MIIQNFKGYQEGRDITQIPANYLAYPSKNVLVHKGKVYTRLGLTVFGASGTVNNKVHSEKVWKNSKAGEEIPLRCTGTTLQAYLEEWKTGAGWVDVFDGFDSNLSRVEFSEWVDTNTSIIKSRLIMVDGSVNMYQWNGAIAVVESVAGDVITISGSKTLEQLGFDDGTTTQQTVVINGTEYTYSHNPTTDELTLDSTPSGVSEGDLVVVKPLTHSVTLSVISKDHIYNYKGHLVIGGLESVDLYFSHATDYSMSSGFNFTVPAPTSRTALSPMYFTLDGKITAMHERKNVLWVSTADDWFKITKLYEQNGYGEWSTVEKVESAQRKGAMPYAVSAHKGDMIFLAQDKTVQTVTDLEILQSDQLKLISDDIEDLLIRLDLTGARIYYHGRYIFITVPVESTLLILDTVEGYWQPPQTIPIERLSIIDGTRIGHSNNRDKSFSLFSGKSDLLEADIEAIIALGSIGFEENSDNLSYKSYDIFGLSGYITPNTKATVENLFEYSGAKSEDSFEIDGNTIKTYKIEDDTSLGKHPFASRSWGGGDYETTDLARFYVFDRSSRESFFEFQPKITIIGSEIEFHLTALSFDVSSSDRTRPSELFISK